MIKKPFPFEYLWEKEDGTVVEIGHGDFDWLLSGRLIKRSDYVGAEGQPAK